MKTKTELIEEVLRLDGERTQGDWSAKERGDYTIEIDSDLPFFGIAELHGNSIGEAKSDAAFIALAPQMARIIRDLKAQRDMAVEALEGILQCQNFDDKGKSLGWRISAGKNKGKGLVQSADDAREALAKIKSGEWMEG